MWRFIASRPLRVERRGEVVEVERDAMRLVRAGRARDQPRERRQLLDEVDFSLVIELREVRFQHLVAGLAEAVEWIHRVELTMPVNFPDPDTTTHTRYQFLASITANLEFTT